MGVVAVVSTDYDEGSMKAALELLPVERQVLFACACAERLLPLYGFFSDATGLGDPPVLRQALDRAWAVTASTASDEVDRERQAVEGLVPHDDDDDWSVWSPFAQNAAAAVAYALRTLLSGDSQNAVWAARQLYEAADYLVQVETPGPDYADGGKAVTVAVAGIAAALSAAGVSAAADLRAAAVVDGSVLRRLAEQTESA